MIKDLVTTPDLTRFTGKPAKTTTVKMPIKKAPKKTKQKTNK